MTNGDGYKIDAEWIIDTPHGVALSIQTAQHSCMLTQKVVPSSIR